MSQEEDDFFLNRFTVPFIYPIGSSDLDLKIIKKLEENLPKFKEGTQSQPGEGYTIHDRINPTEFIEDNKNLKDLFQRMTIIDFNFEQYGNVRKFEKNKFIIEKGKKGISYNTIFWVYPRHFIITGSKETGIQFKKSFEYIFKKKINLKNPIEFDPWFMIWIIDNYRNENYELETNFNVDFIEDMIVEGNQESIIGKKISAKQSLDVTRSISILYPLLKKLLPVALVFSISIDNLIGTMKLKKEGSIQLYLSRGIFIDINSINRAVVGCYFIERVIKLYNKWEKLPKHEKYPSPDFIKGILKECDERGIEITADVDDTIKLYEDKRK